MPEHLHLVSGGAAEAGLQEERAILDQARAMLEDSAKDFEVAGFELTNPDVRSAMERVIIAKLRNPWLSVEEAKTIHPRAQDIFNILGLNNPRPPTPAAPGGVLEKRLRQEPPANDDAASWQQAA